MSKYKVNIFNVRETEKTLKNPFEPEKNPEMGKILREGLESMGWKNIVKTDTTIVIKINGCHYRYLPGLVTTPALVGHLVSILKERAKEVIVGESDLQRISADVVLKDVGYKKIVEKAGGKVVNFSKDEMVEVKINGEVWEERKMPKTLVDCDVFFTVPVLKTHKLWKVSLALKNQFGCVPESDRLKYQRILPLVVSDFNKFLKPKIVIVDGIIGLEGDGPIAGIPKKTGLMIFSDNVVAADTVSSLIMGFKPAECEMIKNAYERGLGPINLEDIEVISGNLKDAITTFIPPSNDIISCLERRVRKHPKLSNLIYRSALFNAAKKTAWWIRGVSGYKSKYMSDVEKTGIWKNYDYKHLLTTYIPIA